MIHPITVASKRDKPPSGEYVGRPSPLGNRYKLRRESPEERARVIGLYARWLDEQLADVSTPAAREFARLRALVQERPVVLVCWCAPLQCHADVIADRLRASF